VAVSAGVDVNADGIAERHWVPTPTTDGVAALVLDRDGVTGAQYRLSRSGETVEVGGATHPVAATQIGAEEPHRSRSGMSTVSGYAYSSALRAVTDPTGLTEDEVGVSVLGTGSFPAPGGQTVEVVTLAVLVPGGAVVVTTGFGSLLAGTAVTTSSWTGCGSTGYPVGTDPAGLTVVARCASYAGDSSTFGVTLIVAGPPGAAVTLDSAGGGTPVTPPLTNGWAYVIDGADTLTQFSVTGLFGTVSREGADLFSG